jgi:hypothetical protein
MKRIDRSRLVRRQIRKWREFQRWVDDHSDSSWVFRGHGDTAFDLLPSIGRVDRYSLAYELAVFELFKLRAPEFFTTFDKLPLDVLAIAQHHGVPTRLLDWTSNPLAAAYFAVLADPASKDAKLIGTSARVRGPALRVVPAHDSVNARIVAVRVRQSMKVKQDADPFSLTDVRFFWPRSVTSRITDQGGLFSIHPEPNVPWRPAKARTSDTFDVPGEMRAFFAKRLFYLGINAQRIMGGLDGLGARLNWQYTRGIGLGTY